MAAGSPFPLTDTRGLSGEERLPEGGEGEGGDGEVGQQEEEPLPTGGVLLVGPENV